VAEVICLLGRRERGRDYYVSLEYWPGAGRGNILNSCYLIGKENNIRFIVYNLELSAVSMQVGCTYANQVRRDDKSEA
jgi:hypothetical protein